MNEQNTKVIEWLLDLIVAQTPCDCHNQATGYLIARFITTSPEIQVKENTD